MKPGALTWMFAALGLLLAGPAHAADTVYYYSSDTIHSEVVVTDANRNVVERTHYAPYGQVLDRDLRDGPGYTGHEEDPETSLVYMQQRYYDPEAGRFLSTDPVQADGGGGSFNRYEYANDNPYRYTDPFGMCTGSHIESKDGSGACASTGAYTTSVNAVPLAMMQRVARSASRNQIAGAANAGTITSQSTAIANANRGMSFLSAHVDELEATYSSPDNAKTAFGKIFAAESGKLGIEFGANIVSVFASGKIEYALKDFSSTIEFYNARGVFIPTVTVPGRPNDPSYWGWVHTHPTMDGGFSPADISVSIARHVNAYVIFPDQTSKFFDYSKYVYTANQ